MSNANRDRRGSVRAGLSQVHSTLNDGIYDGALPELNYADREELNDEHYGGAPSIPLEDEESIRTSNEDYSEEAKDPQAYAPGPEGDEKGKPTQKNNPEPTNTLTKTKTRFFSPNFKDQRKRVAYRWLLAVFLLMCFCFTILVLMWGVLYRTPHYVRRAKVLAVIQEDQVYRFNDTVQFPSVSSPLYDIIAEVPLSWEIYNATSFQIKYNVEGIEAMNQKVIDLVYKEEFWLALNVQGNVTDTLVRSLISADSDVQFNSTSLFEVVYESGRDITNLPSVLLPVFQGIEGVFQKVYTYQYLPQLLGNITNGDNFNPARVAAAGRMKFNYNDYRPVTDRVTLLSTQIGAVYCLLLTVFQFLVFGPLHGEMSRMIKFSNLWIYRLIVLWSVLFFVSIFWCTVSAMYQVDFTKAFGRAGFVVYWMSTYLYMLAVGGLNENVIMLIILISPSYIGFWILSFVILNLAPAFFAIGYANVFYRYGYAMPLHCIVGINRVIFFDISKHQLGRNYGILCAWVGLNTISMPFVSKFVLKTLHKRARKAAMEKSG